MKGSADSNSQSPLVAIDWGSTNFRAALVVEGAAVDRVEGSDGIRNRDGRDYDDLLASLIGHWRNNHRDLRIVMSGMIGSREGWHEIPYVPAPAGIADLAATLTAVPSRHFDSVAIVPGVRWDDPETGTSDVMRGEETQVAGILSSCSPAESLTICLPGTHSKWIVCRDGKIERFRTFLTGEAFERLTRDSLIAGSGNAEVDIESSAFTCGLEFSQTGGGLLHHLFLGRTEMLTGRVAPENLRSFISGLLIGHEVREATRFAEGPIHLVGDSSAANATAAGLDSLGIEATRILDDVHLAGILAITGS